MVAVYCCLFREKTLTDLLNQLSACVDTDGRGNIVNVTRGNVLDGGFRAFSRNNFDPKCKLNVRFAGEDGIDNGGLTREFLRLAVSAIKNSSLFCGPEDCRNLNLDYVGSCTIYYATGIVET